MAYKKLYANYYLDPEDLMVYVKVNDHFYSVDGIQKAIILGFYELLKSNKKRKS